MIKINLLPKGSRKRVGLGQQIFLMVTLLIATFVGIGFYWSFLNNVIEEKRQQKTEIQQRLDELKRVIAEIEEFEKRRAALESKLAVIDRLKKEQQMPVRFLNELFLTLEDDLWLNSFSETGTFVSPEATININGTALSNPVIAEYVRNLQKSLYFQNVQLLFSQESMAGTQPVRTFQVNASLSVEAGMMQDIANELLQSMTPEDMQKLQDMSGEMAAVMQQLSKFMNVMMDVMKEMAESGEMDELQNMAESGMSQEELQIEFESRMKIRLKGKLSADDFAEFEKVYQPGTWKITP